MLYIKEIRRVETQYTHISCIVAEAVLFAPKRSVTPLQATGLEEFVWAIRQILHTTYGKDTKEKPSLSFADVQSSEAKEAYIGGVKYQCTNQALSAEEKQYVLASFL